MKVSLIANSGIQFFEIDICIDVESEILKYKKNLAEVVGESEESIEVVFPYYRNDTGEFIIKNALNEEALTEKGKVIEEEILDEFSIPVEEENIYKVTYEEALNIYEETWIPIPFLSDYYSNEDHLQDFGPLCWARMYIAKKALGKDEKGNTHTLILAFDTTIREAFEEEVYENIKPADIEAQSGGFFRCPDSDEIISNFYSLDWVQDWLKDIFDDRVDAGIYRDKGNFFSKFAGAYLAFIGLFQELDAFPSIVVYGNQEKSIDVSFVLDIGNSRTCGLLLETSEVGREPFNSKKAQRLLIRDLSRPQNTYDQPFEMKIAFTEQKFGDEEHTTGITENQNLFSWPSLVRVGAEAIRLIALNGNEQEGSFYLSSPKRYLWDKTPIEIPWKSVSIDTRGRLSFDNAFYGIAQNFTESGRFIVHKPSGTKQITRKEGIYNLDFSQDGDAVLKDEIRYRKKLEEAPIPGSNAPRYSRSSLMTFTIFELLLHALSQMNSFKYRSILNHEAIPRKLKNLVLTCPTAMTITDQRELHNAADDAIDLLKMCFEEEFVDFNLSIIPEPVNTVQESEEPKYWMYDEATCSQFAFLYSEIDYRFNGELEQYFHYCGKLTPSLRYENQKSITIASIDIGGGTTDVMICAYQLDPHSNGELVVPQPLFWEGFNLAGDDIMRSIIERTLIPQIHKYAISSGCPSFQVTRIMSDLFGPHTGENYNIKDVRLKPLIVNQVIIPIVYTFIEHLTLHQASTTYKFDAFFYNHPRPSEAIISQINDKFIHAGATDFDLEKMIWQLDVTTVELHILKEIEKLLTHISAIVAQFSCDTILMAGKPTKIPLIKDLMIRNLPVSPDRIITLGNYRIGNWYPFSDSIHKMSDPKTIVCVGAAISHMSEMGRLSGFNFNTEPLKAIKSTANFIGKYSKNSARIKDNDVYISQGEEEGEIIFSNSEVLIGKRQLANSQWRAAPIFQIKMKNKEAALKMRQRKLAPPFKLRTERSERSKEELIYEITAEDRHGNEFNFNDFFTFQPQSLPDEFGYWLDTGCFSLDILNLD